MADALDLDALEATAKAATPGPWRWYGDIKREIRLTTVARGIIYVLAATRVGMNGATFEVQGDKRMARINDFAEREVPYRDDILPEIKHPDAAFISAANPATVLALIARCRAAEQRAADAEGLVAAFEEAARRRRQRNRVDRKAVNAGAEAHTVACLTHAAAAMLAPRAEATPEREVGA